jgi:hypothetical protein
MTPPKNKINKNFLTRTKQSLEDYQTKLLSSSLFGSFGPVNKIFKNAPGLTKQQDDEMT